MKKNIAIGIMAGLAVLFLHLWQSAVMREESHKKKVMELAEVIAGRMKTGQENFEWKTFIERRGIETLLTKSLEGVESERMEDIQLEIEKRLLNYSREIYVVEPREVLVKKLLDAGAVGEDYLTRFVKEAKETIRIYEEERGKKWK